MDSLQEFITDAIEAHNTVERDLIIPDNSQLYLMLNTLITNQASVLNAEFNRLHERLDKIENKGKPKPVKSPEEKIESLIKGETNESRILNVIDEICDKNGLFKKSAIVVYHSSCPFITNIKGEFASRYNASDTVANVIKRLHGKGSVIKTGDHKPGVYIRLKGE